MQRAQRLNIILVSKNQPAAAREQLQLALNAALEQPDQLDTVIARIRRELQNLDKSVPAENATPKTGPGLVKVP